MASAAAVAADSARSPLGLEVDETHGIVSTVTANDAEHTGLTDEDEEEDDDVVNTGRRAQRPVLDEYEQDGFDLFGDEEREEDNELAKVRHLDDAELDSGDDEDRDDRIGDGEEQEAEMMVTREKQIQETDLPRLPVPEPSDGELYLLKVPKFLSIAPRGFVPEEFEPPTADHHSKAAGKNFSAYDTAATTIRWRRSPSTPSEMQSNARINRWSDGSLTLQLAGNPKIQYDLKGNALVPPQRNPVIPTPTSSQTHDKKAGRRGMNGQEPDREKFDASKHAFTYLVMPLPNAGLMKVTHAVTTGLTVSPPEDLMDEAIVNLQADLAVAGRKTNGAAVAFSETMEDPELAKKRAEQAEREKARARKKADAQLERERDRSNRALGRSGLTSARFGGLSAGMLEDDEGMATTRGRGAARPKVPRRRRANSEYSSEEDYGRRSFKVSKEDDYDVEDDFVAASDEEEEVVEDEDEDEDEGIIEEGRSAARREDMPKRQRPDRDDADEVVDARGGEDDNDPDAGVTTDRKKRRLVVDDEDEDE